MCTKPLPRDESLSADLIPHVLATPEKPSNIMGLSEELFMQSAEFVDAIPGEGGDMTLYLHQLKESRSDV